MASANIVAWAALGTPSVDTLDGCTVLKVPDAIRPMLEGMWRTSGTFRRQCARLTEWSITVEVVVEPKRIPGTLHALTDIRLRHGRVQSVYLQLRSIDPEHLGHEIEHVLEQIDGIDLRRAVANHVHGAREVSPGHFETSRARAIGRLVAQEAMWQR